MRTAIASTGNGPDSTIDRRFGRCSYFVIYDSESMSVEFVPNPHRDAEEGAGEASVRLLASKNVNRIVSGEFGLKIKPILDSLKIQMIVIPDIERRLSDILEMLRMN